MKQIRLRNLCVTLQGKPILKDLNATIDTSCAIVGTSGSGKSTLAKALLGLVPFTGCIEHDNTRFAFIPQDPATSLHPMKKIAAHFDEICPKPEQETLLAAMGFTDPHAILRSYPHQLSGGMKQRVLIALALASQPDVLIADEPTTGLDIIVQRQITELLASLKIPILLITHDERVARKLCPTKLVLEEGGMIYYGSVS
jgi:peptide/nickel transport system ATP-binding protein